MRWCKHYKQPCFAPCCSINSPDKCEHLYEVLSMIELDGCLRGISYALNTGYIPIKVNGKEVSLIEPELEGEDGDYWCNIIIKEKSV